MTNDENHVSRFTFHVSWLGIGVLALALIGPVARFIETSSLWIDYPYVRPGSEGLILYETLLLKRSGDIYAPITPEHFISGPYPPVYYWLSAIVTPGTLPDFSDSNKVTSLLQPGRTISLISALIAAAMVPLLVMLDAGNFRRGHWRTTTLIATGAITGGVIFLTLPQVLVWATRFRGDMLMIALTAAGLVCVAAGSHLSAANRRSGWSSPVLVLGALFFALGFFTKQTALAGPVASAAYLLLRDWRIGLKWCGLMLAAVAVPFVVLDVVTGHWFYLKMVVYHSLPFSRVTFTRLLHYAFWDEQWPLIVLAVGYVASKIRPADKSAGYEYKASLRRLAAVHSLAHAFGCKVSLTMLFILASLITLPTGAVVGADHNHLLMPGLAICAGVGALLAWVLSLAQNGQLARFSVIFAPIVLLLVVYAQYTSPPTAVAYGPDLDYPSVEEQEQLRKITHYIRNTPGDLFYADDQGILALAGKQALYDDPFTMTALAKGGRWDESALRTMLREVRFERLVLSCDVGATLAQGSRGAGGRLCRTDVFTPGVLEAINSRYEILFRDVLFTYVSRP